MLIVRSAATPRIAGLAATVCCLFLTACGGGGGGSAGPAGNPGSVVPVAPTGNALSLTLSPSSLSGTVYHGDVTNFTVTATVQGTTSGNVYLLVTDPNGTFNPEIPLSQTSSTTYTAYFTTSPSIAIGDHPGNVHVQLCSDSNCQQVLAAADLPYDIKDLSSSNQTPLTSLKGAGDWLTYQKDATHSGYVPVTLTPSQFTVRWVWDSPEQDSQFLTSNKLVAASGYVYAAEMGNDSVIYALNENTGAPAWTFDFAYGADVFDPAVSNGTVYVTAFSGNSGHFYGLSASSGTQSFETSVLSQGCCYGAPVGYGSDVFELGASYDQPIAFNGTTGAIEWGPNASQSSERNTAVPAIDANNFYFYSINDGGGVDQTFYVLDKTNGSTVNSLQDPGGSASGSQFIDLNTGHSLVLVGNNNAIVNTQAHLDDFEISPISMAWSISGNFAGDPAVANGMVYVQSIDPYQLQARSTVDGSLKWTWTPPAAAPSDQQGFGAAPIVTNNLVILSTFMEVDAIDLSTHSVVWTYPGPASDLVISTNGILYINRSDAPGIVVAVNLH